MELINFLFFFFKASGRGDRKLLALASKERLVRILEKMLDENEFLSEHGIRSYVFSPFHHLSFHEFWLFSLTIDDVFQNVTLSPRQPLLDERQRR